MNSANFGKFLAAALTVSIPSIIGAEEEHQSGKPTDQAEFKTLVCYILSR